MNRRIAFVIVISAFVIGWLAWHLASPDRPHTTHLSHTPHSSHPAPATITDPTEVFRRAFWRDPAPDDHILHAERREWRGEKDGVRCWQWFIALEPGPAFTQWLRDTNPFNLTQVTEASIPGTPDWFPSPSASCEIQQASNLTLIFDREQNRLYATDSGGGFSVALQR